MVARTKKDAARKLGISESYLHRVRREKTASRDFAEKLAEQLGGSAEDYLRSARPKGRRSSNQYVFRAFIWEEMEKERSREVGQSACPEFIYRLYLHYQKVRSPQPPDDFKTLERLVGFTRGADFNLQFRDDAATVWKECKRWRARQKYEAEIFDIEMGDDIG